MLPFLLACATMIAPPDPLPEPPRRGFTLVFERALPVAPEVAWAHVTEPERISAWSQTQIALIAPGPGGGASEPGAIRGVDVQIAGRSWPLREVVVAAEPPERFVYSVYQGPNVRWHRGEIALAPTEEGAALTWTVQLAPTAPGTGPLVRRTLTRQFEQDLSALEALLGAPPTR